MALAAARRRLALHHGGGGLAVPMPGRGGGGGGAAEDLRREVQELRDRLRRFEVGDGVDRRAGGTTARGRGLRDELGRGGRGGGGAVAAPAPRGGDMGTLSAADRQARPGDWKCRCGFAPNFAHRRRCFACGKPRPEAPPAGPRGAGGSRPLLAWDKARYGPLPSEDKSPTHRPPGSSVAARAAASAEQRCDGKAAGQRTSAATSAAAAAKAETEIDGDGFQLVRGKKKGKNRVGAGDGDGAGEGDQPRRGGAEPATTGAAASGAAEGEGADGRGDDDLDDDDDSDAEGEEDGPTPMELRQRWQKEIGVVKSLAKQLRAEHPALRAATEARDAAEAAWRSAKDPTPLSLRMSRSQAKLERAIELQGETHAALCELERDFEAKRDVLRKKLEEDRERVAARRRQLEEVQEEAGAQASGGVRRGGGEAIRQACGTLQGVAPVIAALANEVDASSPAWRALSGILESLQASQRLLEQAVSQPAKPAVAQQFNIGDAACGDARGAGAPGTGSECAWSESHDLPQTIDGGGQAAAAHPPQAQQGHGAGQRCSDHPPGGDDQDMGTGNWWESGGWQQHQHQQHRWQPHGHGKWSKTDWADAWEEERGGGGEDEGAREPAAKHRRQDCPGSADAGGEADAAAAAAAAAAAEVARAKAEAQRAHAERVAAVVNQAIDAGVQPLTPAGEELHMLDANQLAAWVAEHLHEAATPNRQGEH